MRYDAKQWEELAREMPFDLAVDRASSSAIAGYAVRIVKPAWEEVPKDRARTVITSAMDHPLGQLFAAWEAARFEGNLDDCGLLTHWLFEPDLFSESLGVDGCRLVPPQDAGLGLGELLDTLPWKAL